MNELPKWEYRLLTFGGALAGPKDEDLEDALNELGAEGWEMVNAFSMDNSPKVHFLTKRLLTHRARRQRTMPV